MAISETRRSTCSRDCPDACALIADVENNRITQLRGDPNHPVTQGFLCSRTSNFPAIHTGADRIREAHIRRDGVLQPAPLEEALALAAERLLAIRDESGPAAVFHYRSGGSLGLLKQVADRFFEEFGPCTVKVGDICSGAGEAAQVADFGVADSNDLHDLENSRHIVIWGKNPLVSNLHLVPVLKAARARGASVTLIDPVHHRGVSLADRYIQPKPGTDIDFALAVAQVLRDEHAGWQSTDRVERLDAFSALVDAADTATRADRAGVSVDDVRAVAASLSDGPTAILVGWGMQRRLGGAAVVRALDALCVLSGNLGRSGGGCSFYFQRRGPFDAIHSGAAVRTIREPLFGEDVLAAADPPVRALWVTAGNPVSMLPDSKKVAEAVESVEFVVVVDPFWTDTARRADVVLPVPTLFEDDDLVGAYGHHWISESRPLVDAPDGVVQEVEIFRRLAQLCGVASDEAVFEATPEDWKRRLLKSLDQQEGLGLDALRDQGGRALRPKSVPKVAFEGGAVSTSTGKVPLLTADDLDGGGSAHAEAPSGEYPLWLFSNSVRDGQASQWTRPLGEHVPVTVHPETAQKAGCADGDIAMLRSATGSIRVVVRVDVAQRRDTAIVPKGGHFDRGQSANTLIQARATDQGLGAAFLDCHVCLEAAPS